MEGIEVRRVIGDARVTRAVFPARRVAERPTLAGGAHSNANAYESIRGIPIANRLCSICELVFVANDMVFVSSGIEYKV